MTNKQCRIGWLRMALAAVLMAVVFFGYGKMTAKAAGPTVYGGVDYAAVYDYDYYISHHADLKAAFGGNAQLALQHFVTHGMAEHRQAKATFNVDVYKSNYADLRQVYGEDIRSYYLHYMMCGQYEGRVASGGAAPSAAPQTQAVAQVAVTTGASAAYAAEFDYRYYYNRYPDLQAAFGLNEQLLLNHWLTCGKAEGRIAKASAAPAANTGGSSQQARDRLNAIGRSLPAAYAWAASLTWTGDIKSPDIGTRAMANIGFSTGTGGCYVMAACFYEMARELGYEAHQMTGVVPLRSGGLGPHSWVEVVIDGVTYVVDPDFAYETGKSGYLIRYGQKGTWMYQNYSRMN